MNESRTIVFTVLLFSVLREKVGRAAVDVAVPAPATGSALLDALEAAHPAVAAYRPVIRLAVNQTYVPESVDLQEGDEVALITPVSGG
ncbi:molybdopterin synthase sulfur carrier subunit [Rhodothermaceae bacterium RA]|nr:molybdopterin synthase sulfur carrier subunit [Rhodothermaceae bacterium RA]